MKEASYWTKFQDNKINCHLCPKECIIAENKFGFCRVRQNMKGVLYSTIYEEITSMAMDPVEKKPLYHFYPGSYILSVGTNGCNLHCGFCQNWGISQTSDSGRQKITSDKIIQVAKSENSIGIAYTYNEPFIWFEFVLETAKKAKENNLKNVLVTNGFVNEIPLLEILPFIDAMNIDIKSFNPDFYRKICAGALNPVKKTIEMSAKKCHIEITNLIIPALNDSREEISSLIDWVASIDHEIPYHISRYFPQYRMDINETPIPTLKMVKEIAEKKLSYVYVGNISLSEDNATVCPNCKSKLIIREGYNLTKYEIKDDMCPQCRQKIKGRFI